MKKRNIIPALAVLFLFASSALFASDNPTKTPTAKMPDNVKAIIEKSCIMCHNTNSKNDDAKKKLDFKKLDALSMMKKISAYKHIGETLEENEMPPKKFLEYKPEKKLTSDEKETLMAWAKKEAESLVKGK